MIILQVLILVVFIVVIYRLLSGWGGRSRAGGNRRRFRCADCRHLLASFEDGVSCGLGSKQVFKNPVHISNCMEHEPRDP